MKTADVFVCAGCEKDRLEPSMLIYKPIPNSEETGKCEFCKARRFGKKFRIRYGKST